MQNNLVIVESPAKAKTLEQFLGSDYKVMSSYGHIRDLKKKEFSIDMTDLSPKYEIPSAAAEQRSRSTVSRSRFLPGHSTRSKT